MGSFFGFDGFNIMFNIVLILILCMVVFMIVQLVIRWSMSFCEQHPVLCDLPSRKRR